MSSYSSLNKRNDDPTGNVISNSNFLRGYLPEYITLTCLDILLQALRQLIYICIDVLPESFLLGNTLNIASTSIAMLPES